MEADEVRSRLRRELEAVYGVDGSNYLLDRPAGGWSDLATKQDLIALETRLDLKIDSAIKGAVAEQTWRLITAMLATMSILVAAMVAAVKL